MLNVIINSIDDLPHDAIVSYAHGVLVFLFASRLPQPLRRAITERVGNPGTAGNRDDSDAWTMVVPVGQAAHLTDEEQPLGRQAEWQVSGKRVSPMERVHTKSVGTTLGESNRVSNLQNMIRQRNSGLRLNPNLPEEPTSTRN